MLHKRIISLTLVICAFFCLLPVRASARPEDVEPVEYDAEAAVAFALAYWHVDYWECAQFVSNCLKAGGVEIPLDDTYYSWDDHRYWGGHMEGFTNPGVCAGALLKYLSQTHPVIVNPRHEDMEYGDIIFMEADNPDGHTGIITGFTDDGEPVHCAHNPTTFDMAVGDSVNFVVKMQYTKAEYAALKPKPPQPPAWVQERWGNGALQRLIGHMPSPFAEFELQEADYYMPVMRPYTVTALY